MKSKQRKTDKFKRKIDQLADECGIDPLLARDMVVFNHELKALIDPEKLVSIEVDLSDKDMRRLRSISDTLKITLEAVMGAIIARECDKALQDRATKKKQK